MIFNALYTPMMYRHKKVKNYKEGFIERRDKKLILMDENKKIIENMFSTEKLEDGLELDFDQNYCLVSEEWKPSTAPPKAAPSKPIMPLKRRVGLKKTSNAPLVALASRNEQAKTVQDDLPQAIAKPVKRSRLSLSDVEKFAESSQPALPNSSNSQKVTTQRESLHFSNEKQSQPHSSSSSSNSLGFAVGNNAVKSHQELLSFFAAPQVATTLTKEDPNNNHDDNQNLDIVEEEFEFDDVEDEFESQLHSTPIIPPAAEPATMPPQEIHASIPIVTKPTKKPLLSKFNPDAIAKKNNTPIIHNQYTQPSSIPALQDNENMFALAFDSVPFNERKKPNKFNNFTPKSKSYRKTVIPNTFKDLGIYCKYMKKAIIENINLELSDLRQTFEKFQNKARGVQLEELMRKNHVAYYDDIQIAPFHAESFSYGAADRTNHVMLTTNNKEHHSHYSKDDIWIVSNSATFQNNRFFRSHYHGPSGSSIELVALSDQPKYSNSIFNNSSTLYAIRALSCSGDMAAWDMLNSDQIKTTPFLKNQFQEKSSTSQPDSILLPSRVEEFEELFESVIQSRGLNEDQGHVIRSFCRSLSGRNTCPVVLAHGVYGAGKSFLVAVLVLILEKANRSDMFKEKIQILFSSMTNVAVDRILLSLKDLGFTDFVRVGSLKKIAKPILEYTCKSKTSDIKELNEMIESGSLGVDEEEHVKTAIKHFQSDQLSTRLHECFLIGITCMATNFEVLEGITCPITILDECSQMTEPTSLLPMVKFQSTYALLVGDPKQLAPTLSYTLDPKLKMSFGLERTMFERLAACSIPTILLGTQYRCHPQISNLSNVLFYDSKLKNGIDGTKRKPLIEGLGPLAFVRMESQESKTNNSYKNDTEIALVVDIVQRLLGGRGTIQSDQIGVISLYKYQSDLISRALSDNGMASVQSATVDSFQGSEKDIIILSTVRSQASSFLEDPRRINVALTRAKRHLILLGCMSMANSSKLWRKILEMTSNANPGIVPPKYFLSLLES